jgi:phosphatidylglycerol---prolipoprotein diacylglyceryl transferase
MPLLAIPFPAIDPVAISLGPVAIRWYALAYIVGLLIGWRYCLFLAGRPPHLVGRQDVDDFLVWATLGVVLGGRIGYVLFYKPGYYVFHPLEALYVWHGGMSFHGGFLGVTVAIIAFSRANRVEMLRLADLVAPCVPIGLFFGRIANFINGEPWGRPTTLPWGIIFPGAPDALPRHPSQLYEAGLEGLLLFAILRWATHRLHWLRLRGATTGLFILMYGVFRIALENVRQPDAGLDHMPFGLTMGILLSAPMVIIGAALLWYSRRTPPMTAPAPRQAAE